MHKFRSATIKSSLRRFNDSLFTFSVIWLLTLVKYILHAPIKNHFEQKLLWDIGSISSKLYSTIHTRALNYGKVCPYVSFKYQTYQSLKNSCQFQESSQVKQTTDFSYKQIYTNKRSHVLTQKAANFIIVDLLKQGFFYVMDNLNLLYHLRIF